MGQGTNRVDEPSPEEISEKVELSRERLESLVAELDQRRHLWTRVKQGMKENPAWVTGGAIAIAVILAGTVGLMVQRQRREQRFVAGARRLMKAFERGKRKPERVAAQNPHVARKITTAAASAAASTMVKRVVERLSRDER
jgi:hypothetical protein